MLLPGTWQLAMGGGMMLVLVMPGQALPGVAIQCLCIYDFLDCFTLFAMTLVHQCHPAL